MKRQEQEGESVRIDQGIVQRVRKIAEKEHRTIKGQIELFLLKGMGGG